MIRNGKTKMKNAPVLSRSSRRRFDARDREALPPVTAPPTGAARAHAIAPVDERDREHADRAAPRCPPSEAAVRRVPGTPASASPAARGTGACPGSPPARSGRTSRRAARPRRRRSRRSAPACAVVVASVATSAVTPDRREHAAQHEQRDAERVAPRPPAGATWWPSTSSTVLASPTTKLASALPADHGRGVHGRDEQPRERAALALFEQAPNAELDGEEQEEHRHADREERRLRGQPASSVGAVGAVRRRAPPAPAREQRGIRRAARRLRDRGDGQADRVEVALKDRASETATSDPMLESAEPITRICRPGPPARRRVKPAGNTNAASTSPSSASVSASATAAPPRGA